MRNKTTTTLCGRDINCVVKMINDNITNINLKVDKFDIPMGAWKCNYVNPKKKTTHILWIKLEGLTIPEVIGQCYIDVNNEFLGWNTKSESLKRKIKWLNNKINKNYTIKKKILSIVDIYY